MHGWSVALFSPLTRLWMTAFLTVALLPARADVPLKSRSDTKESPARAAHPAAASASRWQAQYPLLAGYITGSCSVSAGSFTMGTSLQQVNKWLNQNPGDQRTWLVGEQPARPVEVAAFRMGKTPVTVGMYEEYSKAQGLPMPLTPSFNPDWSKKDHPIVNVSWAEATAYGVWASKVSGQKIGLPTEAQWEKAARGTDERIFPWGSTWDARYAVNKSNSGSQAVRDLPRLGKVDWASVRVMPGGVIVEWHGPLAPGRTLGYLVDGVDGNGVNWTRVREGAEGTLVEERSPSLPSRIIGKVGSTPGNNPKSVTTTVYGTRPVGSIPAGASPYDCLDMAGNVYQWCAGRGDGVVSTTEAARVVRGGSWNHHEPWRFRAATRSVQMAPTEHKDTVGFRVALDG